MSASVVEQILARVKAVLLAAATSAADSIFRGRTDPVADEDMPAITVRRSSSNSDSLGSNGQRDLVAFDLEHQVQDTADWETAADALHMQAHAALMADTALAALGRGLRCTGTEAQGESADRVVGRLTARYQMQVFVRPGDLTRSIN